MNAYNVLIQQIDAFIRKYYKNEMLKGLILFVGSSLFLFLLIITLEYFGRFSGLIRAFLFYSFLSTFIYLLVRYIVIPTSKLLALGKLINNYDAAKIIGSFFPEISDRLLNTLQLNDSLTNNDANYELIKASVQQRSQQITAIPFVNGIDLKKNYVYVKYILPLILFFVVIAIFFPSFISKSTERVVNYNLEYKAEAPFEFILNAKDLLIQEDEDFPIMLTLNGYQIPDKVYLVTSNGKYLMNKESKIAHFFVLKRLKESTNFYFEANGFRSNTYLLTVSPKTALGKIQAFLAYPSYLGKKNETIFNAADLEIPEGTSITWNITSKNTSNSVLSIAEIKKSFADEDFQFSKRLFNSSSFSLKLFNSKNQLKDSVSYAIQVTKDAFPEIEVNETIDSLSAAIRFFEGQATDDYGLSSLSFVYRIISEEGKSNQFVVPLQKPSGTNFMFRHAIDFRREKLTVDDKIEYYFVVKDNDAVNGSKTTRSKVFTYELPSLEELNEKRDDTQKDIQRNLSSLIEKSKKFKKDVTKFKKDILNSNSSNWNKQNQLKQLNLEQEQLNKELNEMQLKMQESLSEKEQLSELDKELLEKQELLQNLLNEVMDDELKDLLKQLEELLEKENKNALNDKLEHVEMKSNEINKQLDQSLEMLKRMQVDEKIDDAIKELESLSKDQEQLKNDIKNDKLSDEIAIEKQKELNNMFNQVKEDLKELDKLNKELKKPKDLGNQDELKEDISKEQKEALDKLNDKKQKKAQENQQKAADEIEDLAKDLKEKKEQANKEQQEEDINSLRNILESLLALSFDQESLISKFSNVKDKDPLYKKLGKSQQRIIDQTKIIEDSLNTLASRNPKIASFISKELENIHLNFDEGTENIDEHRKRELLNNLQYVMSGYNNLALMLNESLQQMQNQMQSQMQGSGSCNKPGGKGKPNSSSGDSEDMKEALKKQLDKMKKGSNPGGSKPGSKKGSNPLNLSSQEAAKMAAQQMAIRQKLEGIKKDLNKDGKGTGNSLNPLIQDLEKQEKDLINKRFSNEMIKRQNDILTRLLESEKAIRERGFDEKRESQSGKNYNLSNLKRINEYNNQKLKQLELLHSVDPVFKKYYKDKATEYFNSVN